MTAAERAEAAWRYWQSLQPRGMQMGLERMEKWMELLGHPQHGLKCIHVAGTNGKGSTARMIQCILSEAGYRVGLFSSPVVTTLTDTVTIDGRPIPDEAFADLTAELRRLEPLLQPLGGSSEFEGITALALTWFARQRVDVAVIECGMGGRDDATNIIDPPLAAVITAISLDHTAVLGQTHASIAARKAGIIKAPCLVITSGLQDARALAVLCEVAERQGTRVRQPHMGSLRNVSVGLDGVRFSYGGRTVYHVPMTGVHQCENAILAIETVRALSVYGMVLSDNFIAWGLNRATLPCRQEMMRIAPPVMIDGAHNASGFRALIGTIRAAQRSGEWPSREEAQTTAVVGMLSDKDAVSCLALLAPLCGHLVCCTPVGTSRALPAASLAAIARSVAPDLPVTTVDDPREAWHTAQQTATGPLLATGSFYVASVIRQAWQQTLPKDSPTGNTQDD